MKRYKISIDGCDDSTIFFMNLTDEELAVAERICEQANDTSTYGCMPSMRIEESSELLEG